MSVEHEDCEFQEGIKFYRRNKDIKLAKRLKWQNALFNTHSRLSIKPPNDVIEHNFLNSSFYIEKKMILWFC